MNKDPNNMTKKELVEQLSELSLVTAKNAVLDFIEQWGLPEEILDSLNINAKVQDTKMVRLTGARTKFIKMFTKGVEELLVKKKLDYRLFGFAAHLITFVGYEDNSLRNQDGSYMSISDIATATGVHERTVRRYVADLIDQEVIYEMTSTNNKTKCYYINPKIFYKGVNIEEDILRYLEKLKKDEQE